MVPSLTSHAEPANGLCCATHMKSWYGHDHMCLKHTANMHPAKRFSGPKDCSEGAMLQVELFLDRSISGLRESELAGELSKFHFGEIVQLHEIRPRLSSGRRRLLIG